MTINVPTESEKTCACGQAPALQQRLEAISREQPFILAWYVKDLASAAVLGHEARRAVPSASTRKIAIMMAVLNAVHEGRLSLSQPAVVEERMQRGVVSGTFYYMTPGLTLPLRDVILQMIITSDNICTGIIGELLGPQDMNDWCRRAGLRDTMFRHIVQPRDMPVDSDFDFVCSTSAADQGYLLEQILLGADSAQAAAVLGCSPELCRLALDILGKQFIRNLIPSLLPSDTRVAHKTGTGRNGKMDAGIVYRNGEPLFIIAAYADRVPAVMPDGLPGHAAAAAAIGRLARACWESIPG